MALFQIGTNALIRAVGATTVRSGNNAARLLSSTPVVGQSGRINKKQKPTEKEPIVTAVKKADVPDKAAFCRCWLSDKFPRCDGSHKKHNEATGDNVGPMVVQA